MCVQIAQGRKIWAPRTDPPVDGRCGCCPFQRISKQTPFGTCVGEWSEHWSAEAAFEAREWGLKPANLEEHIFQEREFKSL